MKKCLKMFDKSYVYPDKNNLFGSGQSFAGSDAEIVGAERQEMKMMTEVEKEQWETLDLRNSMKQKSYTFKDNAKMNKIKEFLYHTISGTYCLMISLKPSMYLVSKRAQIWIN